jgi:hypothetical protein
MEDDELVEHVAREFIERHGVGAGEVLREHAERFEGYGDRPSAQTWLDIADAAERLIEGWQ